MAIDYLLAIDGGQTSTEALVAHADGRILAHGHGGPMDHVFAGGGERARAAIHVAIVSAYAAAGVDRVAAVAVGGVTGVGPDDPELQKIAEIIGEVVRAEYTAVVPDYVTNLAGASGGRPGVAVIAGGGAVAYGRTEDGREAVAGGFGYLLGDEGGGYDIGRRAVGAAIRAFDGRGIPTMLEPMVKEALGLAHLNEIKRVVYVPDFSRDQLAALVPLVARAAMERDPVAQGIMATAGNELAQIGLAVGRRLHIEGDRISIYPTGGVFKSGPVICQPFEDAIRSGWPNAQVCPAQHSPVTGALLLAGQLHGIGDSGAWIANAVRAGES